MKQVANPALVIRNSKCRFLRRRDKERGDWLRPLSHLSLATPASDV